MLKHLRVCAVLAAATLAACGTDSTQPSELISTGGPLLGLTDPPIEVDVLQRTTPLLHNYAAAALIGRGGGSLHIPEAGFSITFPPNAVRLPTLVTVTAVPGTAVAYLFTPHGLVFDRPAVITQELHGTEAAHEPSLLRELEGAYFPELSLLAGLTATVTETRPTVVDARGGKMAWTVEHFSGYTASSGRRSGYTSSSGNLIPVRR
jgi:hypothetical protein